MTKRPPFSRSRQRGMALIVALLVVAIVAALSLLALSRQQQWTRQLEHRANFTTAAQIAFAAMDMTRLTLRDDARRNRFDHLKEAWTIPIPPIAAEQGQVGGRLRELQGRYNLTTLVSGLGSTAVEESNATVVRVARAYSLPASSLALVIRAYQAQRKRESGATPGLGELLREAGVTASQQEQFRAAFAVLPEATPVNVNFADAAALQAAIDGLTASEAEAVVAQRTSAPFETWAAFTATLPERLRGVGQDQAVSIASRYFMVEVDAWFYDVFLGYEGLLRRDGTNMPTVLWLRRRNLADS